MQLYYEYDPTVTEWGQYPRFRVEGLRFRGIRVQLGFLGDRS